MIRFWKRFDCRSDRCALHLLAAGIIALTGFANAALLITDPDDYQWFPPFMSGENRHVNMHLGAEYYNIASALVAGRGFSDPFRVETGPTAWMPPMYPTLLAALLLLFGSRAVVAWCIVLFKTGVLIWTGAIVQRLANDTTGRHGGMMAMLIYFAWLVNNFFWFFQITHDMWLNLLLVDAVLLLAFKIWASQMSVRLGLAWGALGGFAFLSNPVLGFAWWVTSMPLVIRKDQWRGFFVSVCVAAAIVTPWLIRNWVTFDRLILVKSNLFYDLYQANYVSSDGVYDARSFRTHPVWTTAQDPSSPYIRLGETAYLDEYKSRFLKELQAHPEAYLNKSANRLLAATVMYKPYQPRHEQRGTLVKEIVHTLPFLSLIVLAAFHRNKKRLLPAIMLYLAYLLPYVAVAFYARYLIPLTPILVLFVCWAVDSVVAPGRKPGVALR